MAAEHLRITGEKKRCTEKLLFLINAQRDAYIHTKKGGFFHLQNCRQKFFSFFLLKVIANH